jgi:hypothetical protein
MSNCSSLDLYCKKVLQEVYLIYMAEVLITTGVARVDPVAICNSPAVMTNQPARAGSALAGSF